MINILQKIIALVFILNLVVMQFGIIANSSASDLITKDTVYDSLLKVCINNASLTEVLKTACIKNANNPKFKDYCNVYYIPAPQADTKYDNDQYYIYSENLQLLRKNCETLYNKNISKKASKSVIKNIKVASRTLVSYCSLSNPKLSDTELVLCKDKIKSINSKAKIVGFCQKYIGENASEYKNCINTPVAKNVLTIPAKPYLSLIGMCEEVYKGNPNKQKLEMCKGDVKKATNKDLRDSMCSKRFSKNSTQYPRCVVTPWLVVK